jgi:uncharacterized membrane protein YbhN (UPF0104 family)
MSGRVRRLVMVGALGILLAGLARLIWHFPWAEAWDATQDANALLLGAALAVNLVSLVAKGSAWQLLLRPVRRVGWRAAQEATLAGSAVADLATSVVGEAARIQVLVRKSGIGWRHALASVVYLRAVEGLGMAVFLLAAPLLVPLPPELRVAQAAAAAALLVGLILVVLRPGGRLPGWLPQPLQRAAATLGDLASARALPAPLLLALVNWAAQWATYALVLRATGVRGALAASFVALVAANLAGLVPVSPGNVGVFQAAIVLGLLPLGVDADRAVLAGIALQAVQIPPVLGAAAMVFGVNGLKQLRSGEQVPSRAGSSRAQMMRSELERAN